MKLKALLSVAVLGAFALTSCNQGNEGKPLSEYKNATAADSLCYLFGEMSSSQYWRGANQDSALMSEAARAAYLKGYKKGIDMTEDKAYLLGLIDGLNLCVNKENVKEVFGVEANTAMFAAGMAYGLSSDTVLNSGTANREYQMLTQRLQAEKMKKDQAAAMTALADYAKKESMQKIDSTLYEKVNAAGTGAELLNADSDVEAEIVFTKADGSKVEFPGLPKQISVANFQGSPIGTALLRMKEGESATFATTAVAMFSQNAVRFGLEPTDLVIAKITIGKIVPKKEEPAAPQPTLKKVN